MLRATGGPSRGRGASIGAHMERSRRQNTFASVKKRSGALINLQARRARLTGPERKLVEEQGQESTHFGKRSCLRRIGCSYRLRNSNMHTSRSTSKLIRPKTCVWSPAHSSDLKSFTSLWLRRSRRSSRDHPSPQPTSIRVSSAFRRGWWRMAAVPDRPQALHEGRARVGTCCSAFEATLQEPFGPGITLRSAHTDKCRSRTACRRAADGSSDATTHLRMR